MKYGMNLLEAESLDQMVTSKFFCRIMIEMEKVL